MTLLRCIFSFVIVVVCFTSFVNCDGPTFKRIQPRPTQCSGDDLSKLKTECYDAFLNYVQENGVSLHEGLKAKIGNSDFCGKLTTLNTCVKKSSLYCPEVKSKAFLLGLNPADSEYFAIASILGSEKWRCADGLELYTKNEECINTISKQVIEAKCHNKMSDFKDGTCAMQKIYVDCLSESFSAKCGVDAEKYACYYYSNGIYAINRRCSDEMPTCNILVSDDDSTDLDKKASASALGFGLMTAVAVGIRL